MGNSAEENKSVNLRWIQAWNERDSRTEAAYRSPEFLAHTSGVPVPLDNNGWNNFMAELIGALPDAQISIEASIAERDMVATRWTITGTHRGTLQGVPATGRLVTFSGIDFSRVVHGKVIEHWAQFDLVAVMQQINAVPATAHA